jgi:hypothetical protein
MTRLKIIGLALTAVFLLSLASVATASASEPELVNKEGKEVVKPSFKDKSGKTRYLVNGRRVIVCKKDKSTGKLTGLQTNVETFTEEECESLGLKCNSEGDAAGIIKSEWNSKLVYEVVAGKLEAANRYTLLKPKPLKISCGGGVVKYQFTTLQFQALILTPAKKLSSTLELEAKVTGSEKEEKDASEEYEESNGSEIKKLESEGSFESGKEKEVGKVSVEAQSIVAEFEEEVELRA